jgi:ElaB/YqjD/DUF883 family membrane-anchored ribosome-binding protein
MPIQNENHSSNQSNQSGSSDRSKSRNGSSLSGEFQNFITDIEDLLKTTTSLSGAEFEQAKRKLSERVASAKASVEELTENFADKARHSAEATDRYVHEKPWQSVAASSTLSFILGVVVARCCSSTSK